jgi:putative ABC transport system permease protein
LIIRQGMIKTFYGVLIGLAGAFGLTRLMDSLLFAVSSHDPLTFVVISLLLVIISLLACYFPARRAARIDPTVTMRYE